MALSPPVTPRSTDPVVEQIRRELVEKVTELQRLPAAALKPISDVVLVDGVVTPVPHALGRAPLFVRESCPRNAVTAGIVVEVRDGSYDRTKYIALKATGYGATITVDLEVL